MVLWSRISLEVGVASFDFLEGTRSANDHEVKRAECFTTESECSRYSFLDRIQYFSDWSKACRAIALCLRFKRGLMSRSVKKPKTILPKSIALSRYVTVSVVESCEAEVEIFK